MSFCSHVKRLHPLPRYEGVLRCSQLDRAMHGGGSLVHSAQGPTFWKWRSTPFRVLELVFTNKTSTDINFIWMS